VLVPERLRAAYAAGFGRLLATRSELFGTTRQIPVRHVNGSEVIVEVTLSRLDEAGGTAVVAGVMVGVLRDVSTSIRLERELAVGRYLNATLRVSAALTEAPDADVAFERLLPTLCAELDWDAATLWQPETCGGRLSHAGSWTAPGESVPALQADIRLRTFVPGEGLPGLVWHRREPVVVEDLWDDPRFLRPEAARADGPRTAVAFPVLRGDTLLGVCELFSRERRPVPAELVDVLANAGRQIGQFLVRLRAESSLRELADTLQRSLLPRICPPSRASSSPPATGPGRTGCSSAATPTTSSRWTAAVGWLGGGPVGDPRGREHRAAPGADHRPAAVRHGLLPGHRAARLRRERPPRRRRPSAADAARTRRGDR
jgi:hypothetical protein